MSKDTPNTIANVLATLTNRPVRDFDASELPVPNFEDQELEPVEKD